MMLTDPSLAPYTQDATGVSGGAATVTRGSWRLLLRMYHSSAD